MRERSFAGSRFGKTLYFTDREIDRMCIEALQKSGCMPSVPEAIDIELFVEKHFDAQLDMATDLGEEVLGWTFFGKKGEILLVGVSPNLAGDDSDVGRRRCRATVAHEAGHCLMHPILFIEEQSKMIFENLNFQEKRILCRKSDFTGKYDGRWWEVQANKAIGALLLPAVLVRKSVESFLEPAGGMGLMDLPERNRPLAVEHVSKTFDVNKLPAQIKVDALFPRRENELL